MTKKEQMQVQTQGSQPAVEAQPSQQPAPPPPTSPHDTAKPQANLSGRGAAWNNAWNYCVKNMPGEMTLDEFCKKVTEYAEKIAPHQSSFVNK